MKKHFMKFNFVKFFPGLLIYKIMILQQQVSLCAWHIIMPVVTEWDGFCRIFDDFTKKYHRLDMCHTKWDNLSVLQGRNIAPTPWNSKQFLLCFNNGCGECVSTWKTWRSFSTVALDLTLSVASQLSIITVPSTDWNGHPLSTGNS